MFCFLIPVRLLYDEDQEDIGSIGKGKLSRFKGLSVRYGSMIWVSICIKSPNTYYTLPILKRKAIGTAIHKNDVAGQIMFEVNCENNDKKNISLLEWQAC